MSFNPVAPQWFGHPSGVLSNGVPLPYLHHLRPQCEHPGVGAGGNGRGQSQLLSDKQPTWGASVAGGGGSVPGGRSPAQCLHRAPPFGSEPDLDLPC